jgi:very-long-chain (3R)-3-hydroxyacyl-CoA dehydratase
MIKLYLVLYNLSAAVLWAFTLFYASDWYLHLNMTRAAFETNVLPVLTYAQTLAVLEIFHSLFGIVKSPVVTTTVQVFSRIFVLWGFLRPFSIIHHGVALCVISWALVEIPRYLFYAFHLLGSVPYPLLWLRYSLFAVLYPSGITGELWCVLAALPKVRQSDAWSIEMPNQLNFECRLYWLVVAVLILYVPGSPFMYLHMVQQRKKTLGKKALKTQ